MIFMECLRTPCYVSASQRGITQKSLDWLQTSKPNAGVECCDLKAPNQTDVTTSPILLKKWAAMSIQSNTYPEKKQYENHTENKITILIFMPIKTIPSMHHVEDPARNIEFHPSSPPPINPPYPEHVPHMFRPKSDHVPHMFCPNRNTFHKS